MKIPEEPESVAIQIQDTENEDRTPSSPAKTKIEWETSISKLMDGQLFSIIKEPAVIAKLGQSPDIIAMIFKQVEISKNIASDADKNGKLQEQVEQLSQNVTKIQREIDTQPHSHIAEIEIALEMINEPKIEKTVDKEIQAKFFEVVGSYQLNTFGTDATIDILKDDENVQKLGVELLMWRKTDNRWVKWTQFVQTTFKVVLQSDLRKT